MHKNKYFLIGLTVLSDIITITIAYLIALWLRFYSGIISVKKGIPEFNDYFLSLIHI